MKTLIKLYDLLSPSERRHAVLLAFMISIMALLDMVGVASILPFMSVLADPQLIQSNGYLNAAFKTSEIIGVQNSQQFLLFLGILVLILVILSLAFRAITTYALTHFALMREFSIGEKIITGYLHQPYCWYLNRHSAELGKNILSEIGNVVHGAIMALLTLIAHLTSAIAILVLLMLVNPILALSIGIVLGLTYASIFLVMSRWIIELGSIRSIANHQRFRLVNEAFSAIKEIKLGNLEKNYIQRFSKTSKIYSRNLVSAQIIAQLPRYALEAVAFGGILTVTLFLVYESGGFATVLPIISLYVFAGYRLMPALQQVYSSLAQIRFAYPALSVLHSDVINLPKVSKDRIDRSPLKFTKEIKLNQIFYSYPNSTKPSLNSINITIPKLSTIGFVGATGSGKTTTVDIILGLLEPQEGLLTVDNSKIDETNLRDWQKNIGYVPQQIYLTDDTVSANIAFGVDPTYINQKSIENASRVANLHDFVISELPQGYDTLVGERGVRLSGGQRQRIGIARALYHNPQLLILDEATSALDTLTEQAVMEAVNNLGHKITIIMIAHRLSTVRNCDHIYLFESGTVQASGTYAELKAVNAYFASMAKHN